MAAKSIVARRLLDNGHTISEVTELISGHPGNDSWYVVKRAVKAPVDKTVVAARLRNFGYTVREARELLK